MQKRKENEISSLHLSLKFPNKLSKQVFDKLYKFTESERMLLMRCLFEYKV